MFPIRHFLLVVLLAAGTGLVALPALADPIRIVAAESFYGDLARQLGGSHVEVTSILTNPDDDPHLFESSPSTARTIAEADIVIYNGVDYDPWMDRLLSTATVPARTILVAANLTGHRSGDNPHLWYDPATFPAVAKALVSELAKRDAAAAPEFNANLVKFNASFASLMARVASIKTAHAGVSVTATEPVFGYMAQAMGFTMLNERFQFAVMNGAEPSASDVAAFENSLKDRSVRILFYNSQVTDDATARLLDIAKASGVQVVGVTETEPARETIQTWFGKQIDAVEAALASHT